jgi:hypothetical protein
LYPLRFGVKTYGPRHLVPAAFVLGIIALATLTAIVGSPFGQLLVAVLAIYLGTAVLVSVRVAGRERDPLFAMVMPPLFLLLHVSYGLGTIAGAVAALFQRYISGTSPAPAAVAKR